MPDDPPIFDQGVRWKFEKRGVPLTLESMIELIESESGNRQASIDDFWLRSRKTKNQLQICAAFSDRVALLFMVSEEPSPWLWLAGPANSELKVRVWDPGMSEWDIPSEYFVSHSLAIPFIQEFWESGTISDLTNWREFDFDEISVDYRNSSDHAKSNNSEQDEDGKASPAIS